MWQQWVNGVLALWIILSPFMGFEAATLQWNLVIVGAVMAVLAFWGAMERTQAQSR